MKLNVVVLLSCVSVRLTDQSDPKQNEENHRIICPKSQAEATVGEDVTLDCYLQPQRDVTTEQFEWKFNKKERALVYRSKGFSETDQAKKFKNRVSLGSDGSLTEGKIPLKITNVSEADEGTYSCSVGKKRRSCEILLNIEPPKKSVDKEEVVQFPSMTPKLTDRPKNNTGIIAGLAGGILFLLAVCVICCYCQNTKQKTDQDTIPEPSDPAPEEQLLTSEGEPLPTGSHAPPTPERTGTEERKRGKRTTSKPETLRLKNMGNTSDSSN